MAHVTDIQNGTAAPPPSPKRAHVRTGNARGRPVTRSQDPSSPDALAIDELEESVFEMMPQYPAEEWEKKLSSYLYRLAPIIDRGKTGSYHNVQMYSKPVTQDEIMRASYGGSGRYRLILKRYDPTTRQTLKIKEEDFSILNQDFPPCIPYGEWVDDDKNREWAWAKPQLEKIAKEKQNPPATASAAGITDPTFGAVFTILERFMPKQSADQTQALAAEVIATMREQHKEQMQAAKGNPDQLVTLVTTIATALKPAAGSAGGDTVLVEMLRTMREDIRAEREQNAKLMERILTPTPPPPAPPPAPTLAQQIKDMVDLKGSIGQLFGRSNPGDTTARRTDWGEVVARSVEKIVEEGPRYMQAIFTGRSAPRTINHQRPPAATAPDGEPRELTQAEQEDQTMGAIQDINAQFGATFDEFTPELVKTFDRDLSGMDFRDWFIEEFGARVYSFLRKMDVRTILGVIELRKRTAPDHLRPQLALLTPPAKVEKFILEFQSSDPPPAYDDAEEEAAGAQGAPAAPQEKEF